MVRCRQWSLGVLVVLSGAVLAPAVPASGAPAPTVRSLYTRMRAETAALEDLAQRSLENQERAAVLRRDSTAAERAYREALTRRERAAGAANAWARTAYMTTPGPSPLDGLAGPGLGRHTAELTTAELTTADAAVRGAEHDWQTSAAQVRALDVDVAADRNAVAVRSANLRRFRLANSVLIARQQAAAAASDMSTYRSRVAAGLVDGSTGPVAATALAAVRTALAQLGKPYVFGAEGPDTFDCSGLVQYAYAHAGVGLPRTARPQFRATRPVPPSRLLPGDLLFFATDKSNWDTIHHVGIYLGGGRMVHAPTTGDVVRVAPVWWAEYFGATRVVSAGG